MPQTSIKNSKLFFKTQTITKLQLISIKEQNMVTATVRKFQLVTTCINKAPL